MVAHKFAWKCVIGLTLALGACAGPHDASESEVLAAGEEGILEVSSSALTVDAGQHPVMIGDVIANHGYVYMLNPSDGAAYGGSEGWDTCPTQHSLLGHVFDPNGFWLCARPDLASRTFYVGDVEANYGYFFRVNTSGVSALPSQNWDHCPSGTTLIGRRFDSNGFWICMSSQ